MMAEFAIANLWVKFNGQKDPISDPWTTKDNFRVNNAALQKVVLQCTQSEEKENVWVECLPNNKFSVHKGLELDGSREYIIENVQV